MALSSICQTHLSCETGRVLKDMRRLCGQPRTETQPTYSSTGWTNFVKPSRGPVQFQRKEARFNKFNQILLERQFLLESHDYLYVETRSSTRLKQRRRRV